MLSGRGSREATKQLKQAYVILLSSQFQGFCRDLHSESVDDLLARIEPASTRRVLQTGLVWERRLDRGNPTTGNIGSDFGRMGIDLWSRVLIADRRNAKRRAKLNQLNAWRNAIAHDDLVPLRTGDRATLHFRTVRRWRGALNALAEHFDQVLRVYVDGLFVGSPESERRDS